MHHIRAVVEDDGRHVADVWRSVDSRDQKWKPPTINWSAWGDNTPDVAQAFAYGLRRAVSIAKRISGDVHEYAVDYEYSDGEICTLYANHRLSATDEAMIRADFATTKCKIKSIRLVK